MGLTARRKRKGKKASIRSCLLYTSDAADEEDSVDLGGRRIIKLKLKLSARSIIPAIVNPYSVFISTSLTSYSLVRCLKLD